MMNSRRHRCRDVIECDQMSCLIHFVAFRTRCALSQKQLYCTFHKTFPIYTLYVLISCKNIFDECHIKQEGDCFSSMLIFLCLGE